MKHYSIHVEVNRRDHTLEDASNLLVALSDYSTAVGTSPFGWLDVQLTVPADSLAQATRTAIALVSEATGVEAIRVEAMTEEQFDIRQGHGSASELIGAAEAATLLKVTKQRIAQMVNEGKLSGQKVGNSLVFERAHVEAQIPPEPEIDRVADREEWNDWRDKQFAEDRVDAARARRRK